MTRLTQLPCLLALAAAFGCGETQNPEINQLTFDRPVDVAFACYGQMRLTGGGAAAQGQDIQPTAMPASACETRSQPPIPLPVECQPDPDPANWTLFEEPTPPGQETLREGCRTVSETGPVNWYGLILQSGPGTVAIAEFATKPDAGDDVKVMDAAQFVPGKNSISVGEDPVAIHVDPVGCHAITANAGSCDLSVLELNSVLDGIGTNGLAADPAVQVDRLEVKNAAGAPIRSRPAAMVGQPSETLIGNACEDNPRGLVYVAYPSCHLVAAVDTSTGTIVSGIQYDAAGTPTIVGGDVTCPDECGGGATATPGVRPATLDLEVDPRTTSRRLVIGADNSASITVAELDMAWRPSLLFQVALEDGTGNLGVTSLALSPEIGMGGFGLEIDDDRPTEQFQFVYAVVTDGTVRVADVLEEKRECDTQVDPRFARAITSSRDLACLPIGTLMTPRRPGARGPGIELPGEAIPLSVEFFRAAEPIIEAQLIRSPTGLLGHFAVITMSNGAVFLANVDDDNYPDVFNLSAPLDVSMPLAMAHQLRDVVGQRHVTIDDEDQPFVLDPEKGELGTADDRDCSYSGKFDQIGEAIGGPRAPAPPGRVVPTGTVATEKLTQLPGFRQLLCDRRDRHGPKQTAADRRAITELAYAAPADVRDRSFPDLLALPATETWTLVWEGSLSLNTGSSDIDGPAVREGLLRSSSLGLHVLDDARPFCEAGVEPFDILELRGCDASVGAADCPSGYTCFVHPETKIPNFGTCMLPDEADRLADACRDFMTSLRRYTVKTTASGELIAVARRHELRTTPLDGCVSDQQCEALADYAARSSSPRHPFEDNTPADPSTWACVADPERAPMGGTGKRCQLRCTPFDPEDPDRPIGCVTGTVCKGGDPKQPSSGFCMEGVVPSQSCINATQRYQLRAGEAFAVIGSQAGFVHPIIEDAAGQCVRDPMASPLSIGRLPLMPKDRFAPDTLHICTGAADEPNPCSTTVPHIDVTPQYTPMTCSLATTDPLFVERQAPAVRFRNRSLTLTLVDPYYPGDATCITDRQANLGQIPHLVPGTTLSVRVVGGFAPMRALTGITSLDSLPSFPVKVVRGPAQSLWVLDEGDFLSSSSSQASTRGKVLIFRPESPASALVIK
jgi:hypothetical protein